MSTNENLSSNLILTIRLKEEVSMNKKELGQRKLIHYSLFKEEIWREEEERKRGVEENLNQQERKDILAQISSRINCARISRSDSVQQGTCF